MTTHISSNSNYKSSNKNVVILAFMMFFSFFIIYGTSIPLDFKDSSFALQKLQRYAFLPPSIHDKASWISLIPDILQNIIVFIPLGILGGLLVESRKTSVFVFYLVTLYGALLSTTVETIQLFSATRTTSVIDILTNTGGTICGLIITLFIPWKKTFGNNTRQLTVEHTELYHCLLIAGIIIANALLPFDFSLDPGYALPKTRSFVEIYSFKFFTNGTEIWNMLLYAILTITTINICKTVNNTIRTTLIVLLTVFPPVFESLQVIVISRIPEISDILLCYIGISTGLLSGLLFSQKKKILTCIIMFLFTLCFYCKFILLSGSLSEHRIVNSFQNATEFTIATMFYLGNFFETILILGMCGYYIEHILKGILSKILLSVIVIASVAYGDYLSGFFNKPHYVIIHLFIGVIALAIGQLINKKGMKVFLMILNCRFFGMQINSSQNHHLESV